MVGSQISDDAFVEFTKMFGDYMHGEEDEPGDYFEKSPMFFERDESPNYDSQDLSEKESKDLCNEDPKKFFYLGLHKEYPELERDALKNILPIDAGFYFKFDYHAREEDEFRDLLQSASEYISQQNARAFFYYHLHHKFPELGRGAIIQLIDTNPDSFFDLGLQKDYPDFEEGANNARNIKDPHKIELELDQLSELKRNAKLSVRDKDDKWEDKLSGGLADKKKPEDFDKEQLDKGVEVELEHVDDEDLATEISMDHLTEDPKYYDKLEKVEKHALSKRAKKDKPKAGIFITLPDHLAKQFPLLGNDDSAPHTTALFIGHVPKKHEKLLLETVKRVVKEFNPFEMELDDKVTYFPATKHLDGCKIAKLKIISPELHKLNKSLVGAIESAEMKMDNHFPIYKPHVTLSYMPEGRKAYDRDFPQGSWVVNEIHIWNGDKKNTIQLGNTTASTNHNISKRAAGVSGWISRRGEKSPEIGMYEHYPFVERHKELFGFNDSDDMNLIYMPGSEENKKLLDNWIRIAGHGNGISIDVVNMTNNDIFSIQEFIANKYTSMGTEYRPSDIYISDCKSYGSNCDFIETSFDEFMMAGGTNDLKRKLRGSPVISRRVVLGSDEQSLSKTSGEVYSLHGLSEDLEKQILDLPGAHDSSVGNNFSGSFKYSDEIVIYWRITKYSPDHYSVMSRNYAPYYEAIVAFRDRPAKKEVDLLHIKEDSFERAAEKLTETLHGLDDNKELVDYINNKDSEFSNVIPLFPKNSSISKRSESKTKRVGKLSAREAATQPIDNITNKFNIDEVKKIEEDNSKIREDIERHKEYMEARKLYEDTFNFYRDNDLSGLSLDEKRKQFLKHQFNLKEIGISPSFWEYPQDKEKIRRRKQFWKHQFDLSEIGERPHFWEYPFGEETKEKLKPMINDGYRHKAHMDARKEYKIVFDKYLKSHISSRSPAVTTLYGINEDIGVSGVVNLSKRVYGIY